MPLHFTQLVWNEERLKGGLGGDTSPPVLIKMTIVLATNPQMIQKSDLFKAYRLMFHFAAHCCQSER